MSHEELMTIDECELLLASQPDSWRALTRMAELLADAHRLPEALEAYLKVLETFPEQGLGLRKALEISHATEQWDQFLELVPRAREVFPNRSFWVPLHLDALRANGHFETLEQTREAFEADPTNKILIIELSQQLVDNGRTFDAEQLLRSELDRDPAARSIFDKLADLLRTQGRFDDLADSSANVLKSNPSATWAGGHRLVALIQTDRSSEAIDEAEHALSIDPGAKWPLGPLCWALSKERQWEKLLDATSGYEEENSLLTHRSRALAELGRWSDGEALLKRAFENDPGPSQAQALAEHAELRDCWADAIDWWSHRDIPEPLRSEHIAGALIQLHRFSEARTVAKRLRAQHPGEPNGYRTLAMCASFENRTDDAVVLWKQAHELFPADQGIVEQLLHSLQITSQWEIARQVLDRYIARFAPPSHWTTMREAEFHVARYEFDQAFERLDELIDTHNGPVGTRALMVACSLSRITQNDRRRMKRYRAELEKVAAHSLAIRSSLAEQHIALGEFDKALELVDCFVDADATSRNGVKLRSWAAARRGQNGKAKKLGEDWLRQISRRSVHAPDPSLERVTGLLRYNDHDTVVLAAMRDENIRISDFLQHHRRLGVAGFKIVDNGSTDGTFEYLSEQRDVELYRTSDDYVLAGSGMLWINHLISRIDNDCWCLFLDADELFIYPDYENRTIDELTSYLDNKGFDAMSGFMLDMHPESMAKQSEYVPGESLLAHSGYFTNTYDFQPFVLSPYTDVRGGFRPTVLGEMYRQQTKCPLIRSNSGIKFLSSSHETTPSAIADVTSALLHFKFVGDSVSRAVKETEWTTSAYYANRAEGQTAMLEKKEREGDVNFLSEKATKFDSSDQLVELGLLKMPDGFSRPQ